MQSTPRPTTAKKPAPKLTAEQKRRVRSLMEDEGQTRAEATAWVLAFETAEGVRTDEATSLPFCACGRRMSECDGSRAGCRTRHIGGES